jgi:hypothetical protein
MLTSGMGSATLVARVLVRRWSEIDMWDRHQ